VSTTTSRRIRTTVQFPHASIVLRYRAAQVFGNASRCAAALGISRQALNQRLASATKWSNTHEWWSALLSIPVELFATNDLDAVMPTVRALSVPTPAERAVVAAAAVAGWSDVVARSYQWPSAHKASRDARIAVAAASVSETDCPCA